MDKQLTAILIDDEQEALDLLQVHLSQYPSIQIKGKYCNPQDGFMQIIQHTPDVVFLDIEMPAYNGFDLLECLKGMKNVPVIVFVTGYDKYLSLIKTSPVIHVLLKPVDPVKLNTLIEELATNNQMNNDSSEVLNAVSTIRQYNKLAVTTQTGAVFIRFSDIVYLQADGNYTNIFSQDGNRINSSFNLKKFQERLDPAKFIRCHNSIVINTDFLTRIDKRAKICVLSASQEYQLPVSRAGIQLFDQLI